MAVSKIKVNSLGTTGTASATTFLRGDMVWTANAGGDVVGPASATDDALAKYDGTTGKIVQNSNATLSDAGTLTATAFAGPINGNLTGAIQTAAQTNITSVGTLTSFASTGIDDNADAVAVTINSSEQVGIGQTVPTGLLHVKSAGASTTPFRVERSGGSGDELAVNMQGDNRPYLQMYQAGVEKIRFDVGSDSFITNQLGIGVTDPDQALEINGQIKITGGSPGASKVLTSDADGVGSWAAAAGGVDSITDNGSSVNAMTINAAGTINYPLQSCFRVHITSDVNNVTGNGTSYNLTGAIWTEDFDLNSDVVNGTFTAPVNGHYILQGSVAMGNGDGCTDMIIKVVTPAGGHEVIRADWSYSSYASPSSGRGHASFGGIYYIAAAGTAYINIQGYNQGSDSVDIAAFHTNFSGQLLA